MEDFATNQDNSAASEEQAESAAWTALELQTAAALSYAVPEMPLPTHLKARLFTRISQEDIGPVEAADEVTVSSALTSAIEEDSELFSLLSQPLERLKQQAKSIKWEPMGTLDGFEMATWKLDDATNSIAFFVRAKTGGQFPLHRHAEGEAVLVLDGDFVVEGRSYGMGERVDSPAGTSHAPETRTGCLLLCVSSIYDEILS